MIDLGIRIVGLGDSTTAGTPGFLSPLEAPPDGQGNPESQYSYWMMKAHSDWIVLNRGINGQRTDEIVSRFQRDVVQENADYVIILGGVNDVYEGRSLDLIKADLLTMYKRAINSRIIPVAATVLPYDTATEQQLRCIQELNHWIEQAAKDLKIPFCDTNRAVADHDNPGRLRGSPDGLHPDVAGYQEIGHTLCQTIENHLKQRGKQYARSKNM